jgi:peroxiredoxin
MLFAARKLALAAASFGRKQFLAGSFLFQRNRFCRTDPGGQQNLIIAVAFGIDDLGDHLGVELKDFGGGLNAFCVTFAFVSIDGDFHRTP